MEYIRGVSLHRYVRDKRLTVEATTQLFGSVCDAVNYAHQRGVIHRDLKPSNILVDVHGHPFVMDFGLAKLMAGADAAAVSVTGQIVGTLAYMSPEQTRGNPDEVDTRADVYALGVILYELLTGAYPYPVVENVVEVVRHIVQSPPERPSRIWSKESGVMSSSTRGGRKCPIDRDMETIVLRALAKEPDRRYQSAGDLARDARHWLANEPILAPVG